MNISSTPTDYRQLSELLETFFLCFINESLERTQFETREKLITSS